MTNPIGVPGRMDLGSGASVEADGGTVEVAGAAVPVLLLRLPVSRAHALAHSLGGGALDLDPARAVEPSDRVLAAGLEAAAAAVGELGALRCAAAVSGVVGQRARLRAAGVLHDREPRLSPLQRIAVVDSAARWMEQDAGDELARALLASVCSSDTATNAVYVELLMPEEQT